MPVKYQQGVGLLEVLVALLLLAIGVLGFVGLQLRAVEATSEGFNRIQAMNIARDLAEKMRMNNSTTALAAYKTNLASTTNQAASGSNCYSGFCTPTAKAAFDVHEAYVQATNAGMTLNMITCPGTANGRQCIYIAWNKTDPVDTTATTTGHIACTNSTSSGFSYNDTSTCIVMEAY
ncbi:type IV pilus modification protein PilV [Acinetobacter brisouii]|uniref:type IV pilus modification protein PilV n=1 Tax=Acinetobacter brisouii TaxID=396323 RepID=UPI0035B4412B